MNTQNDVKGAGNRPKEGVSNMGKGKTPCYECKDRALGCHGTCPKYKMFRRHYEKIKLNRKFGRVVKEEKR